jgi:uncharacterized membrane protein
VQSITDSPWTSVAAGLGVAALMLVIWLTVAGGDVFGLAAFLFRFLHVLAAGVWVGLIFFVNFVQLVAMQGADEQARGFMAKSVIPQVTWWMRHASTIAVASGVLLLLTAGYLFPALFYGTAVYVPPARAVLVWSAVLAALVMWMVLHMYIWPNIQVALGIRPDTPAAKVAAHERVKVLARVNLILAVPVMLAMVAAAHLY